MNIAIIGYGYWGPNLLRNFMSIPGATVKYVVDSRTERLDIVSRNFPSVKTTTSFDDVINDEDVKAVVIATPVFTHFELAKKALNAGKHCLVEKPLTADSAQAQELVDLAEKKEKVLMIDHTYLYTPAVKKMKSLLQEGSLGTLKYFDSTRINLGLFQPDINVLWDLAAHDISILSHIIEETPKTVQAVGISHTTNGLENIAYLTIKYDSGVIGHFNCSWSSPVKIRHILIGGDKKMVFFDDLEPTEKIKIYDTGYSVKTDEDKRLVMVDYRVGDIFIPKLDKTEALYSMAQDFVDCASNGKRPVSDAQMGLNVVNILSASQRSIKEGGREIIL
jgi:predicted dehydrogenase